MNKLKGHITRVDESGHLCLVAVEVTPRMRLRALVIDTPASASYLKVDQQVELLFKETEVIIETGSQMQISVPNQIKGILGHIQKGKLISKLSIKTEAGEITSIIGTAAVGSLELVTGKEVVALIKLNELMLRSL